ncbi:MAG: PilN domain-containing protein [Gammaproteobacteria bacterium]|nr:PilN domain-containing protein [Gammaproteobacteria bacterium]
MTGVHPVAALREFYRWWLTGMACLMPAAMGRRLVQPPDLLLLDIDPDSGSITHVAGQTGVRREVLSWQGEGGEVSEYLQPFLDSRGEQGINVVVRIPSSRVLCKPLVLPLAAEGNLRKVIAFDMDRQTPFTEEKVWFDCRIIAREPEQDRLRVELLVARRDYLEPLQDRISRWGLRPDRVTVPDDAVEWNLLPMERRPAPAPMVSARTRRLFWLLLASLLAALYLPPAHQAWRVRELETRIGALRPQAEQARSLMEEHNLLLARPRFLAATLGTRVAVIDLLRELTVALPDNTWVSQMSIRGDRIELQGESEAAGAIIELLDRSRHFRDVQFASATTRSSATQRDRFHVSARIAGSPSR